MVCSLAGGARQYVMLVAASSRAPMVDLGEVDTDTVEEQTKTAAAASEKADSKTGVFLACFVR